MPSQQLPGIPGEEHAFADSADVEATIGAVMGHYSRIAEAPENYAPDWRSNPTGRDPLGNVDRRFQAGYAATPVRGV